jgi:hypothetical protein
LILPPPTEKIERSLSEWMNEIIGLKNKTDAEKRICSEFLEWFGLYGTIDFQ